MREGRRARLAEIFRDTQQFYRTNRVLAEAMENTRRRTALYEAGKAPRFPAEKTKAGVISVSKSRTFEAAIRLSKENPGKRIAVLNFASATNPGGGVVNGSSAQEECLCRCSTLYPALDRSALWEAYYNVNRAIGNVLHTDACIFTPGIVICKTDTEFPERMLQQEWVTVDVISCAAPNLRVVPNNQYNPENGRPIAISDRELQRIHEQRARAILAVAAANGAEILVLGAFGCGAFRNEPGVVARAYANVLKDCHGYFDLVEFAVFCRGFETENYDAFKRELG